MGSGLWSRSSVTITQCNSVDNRSIYHTDINQSIAYIGGTDLTSQEFGGGASKLLLLMLTKAGFIEDIGPTS